MFWLFQKVNKVVQLATQLQSASGQRRARLLKKSTVLLPFQVQRQLPYIGTACGGRDERPTSKSLNIWRRLKLRQIDIEMAKGLVLGPVCL